MFLLGNASWIIGSGSAKPLYSGPENDHTLGSNIFSKINEKKIINNTFVIGNDQGQYLFLSSSFINQQSLVVAVIQSESFPPTSRAGRCLTFWYVFRGYQLGRVHVNITTNQDTYMIWSFGTLTQDDSWKFASVGFYADQNYNVKIVLFFFL